MNICDKYYWILNHPKLKIKQGGIVVIEITPHMINPEINAIDDDKSKNTKLQFWVELMTPYYDEQLSYSVQHTHEWELDTGGDTWEEAVESLYNSVLEKYGDYTEEERREAVRMQIGDFNFDKFMDKNQKNIQPDMDENMKNTNEIHTPLTAKDIDNFNLEIEKLQNILDITYDKLLNPLLSIQDAADIELEIICINADIFSYEESLRRGYRFNL